MCFRVSRKWVSISKLRLQPLGGLKIGDPGNEFAAIAVTDMAEDKSTRLDFTWAGSCFEEVVSLPQLARFLATIMQF